MNIIIVHQWFKESATFKHIVYIANTLIRKGHKVLLVSHKEDGDPHDTSGEILFEYTTTKLVINKLDHNFKKEIMAFKPNIVHTFCNQYVSYIGVLIKQATGAKLIIHYEDNHEAIFFNKIGFFKAIKLLLSGVFFFDIWPGYNLLLERRIRKYVDGYDVLTSSLERMLKEKYIKKPVVKIYPPVDLDFINPDIDGTKLRKELKLEDSFLLVHTGTVYCHWMNGYDKFFNSIAIVRKDIPHIKLVFTGRKVGNQNALFDLINRYNLNDIYFDLGYIKNHSEIPFYLAMSDILFEPQSLHIFDEYRLPSKLHNYMASGKPIITFNNGFARELSDNEVIKINFNNESAEDICQKIINLYYNPDLRKSLGHNARKKAVQLFDIDKNTDRLIDFYHQVLDTG